MPQRTTPPDATANPLGQGYTDYWYNAALSWNGDTTTAGARFNDGINQAALVASSLTLMAGDSGIPSGSTNAGVARTRSTGFGANGDNNVAGPAIGGLNNKISANAFLTGGQRHLEGINLLYTDGHVKWQKAASGNTGEIYPMNSTFTVSQQKPTFNATAE